MNRFPYTQDQLDGDPIVTGTFDQWMQNFGWFLCGIGFFAALIAACIFGGWE